MYFIKEVYFFYLQLFMIFVCFVLVNDKIIFVHPSKQPYLCPRI